MVIGKETTLTQGYGLPLNAFQLVGVSRNYGVPHSLGILKFGLTTVKHNVNVLPTETVENKAKSEIDDVVASSGLSNTVQCLFVCHFISHLAAF